jgi:hypothetical protein
VNGSGPSGEVYRSPGGVIHVENSYLPPGATTKQRLDDSNEYNPRTGDLIVVTIRSTATREPSLIGHPLQFHRFSRQHRVGDPTIVELLYNPNTVQLWFAHTSGHPFGISRITSKRRGFQALLPVADR